jgi:hypothetical protein
MLDFFLVLSIHKPPASFKFKSILCVLPVTEEPFQYSPAEPVAYELRVTGFLQTLFLIVAGVYHAIQGLFEITNTIPLKGFSPFWGLYNLAIYLLCCFCPILVCWMLSSRLVNI